MGNNYILKTNMVFQLHTNIQRCYTCKIEDLERWNIASVLCNNIVNRLCTLINLPIKEVLENNYNTRKDTI